MEFGELKRMELRQAWPHEANDFTPWLARLENLRRLGDAVGIEMELERTEVGVGPFFADMLAIDTLTERRVVIENQLGRTDHDHLGKSLTYAAVLDAATVIWIAARFTDEHLRALDWLNAHTSDDISFYGVELELWRIGDSLPAVQFNIVSRPNEAVRRTAAELATGELSEPKRLQLDFWTKFSERLRATGKIPSVQTPRPQNWFDVSLGKTGINLSNMCNTWDRFVGVRVYISSKFAPTAFSYFESRKGDIESAIGEPLIWNPNPEKLDKVILLKRTIDFAKPADVNAAVDWMVEYTLRFREVFSKMIPGIPEMPESPAGDENGFEGDDFADATPEI